MALARAVGIPRVKIGEGEGCAPAFLEAAKRALET